MNADELITAIEIANIKIVLVLCLGVGLWLKRTNKIPRVVIWRDEQFEEVEPNSPRLRL